MKIIIDKIEGSKIIIDNNNKIIYFKQLMIDYEKDYIFSIEYDNNKMILNYYLSEQLIKKYIASKNEFGYIVTRIIVINNGIITYDADITNNVLRNFSKTGEIKKITDCESLSRLDNNFYILTFDDKEIFSELKKNKIYYSNDEIKDDESSLEHGLIHGTKVYRILSSQFQLNKIFKEDELLLMENDPYLKI